MGHWRYLALGALLAGPVLLAAPNDLPILPPPMAQPESLSILRGGEVEIPLRALGRASGQLKFLVRSPPKNGLLGEIRVTGPKSAVVRYTHDDSSAGMDVFTFAVQAIDSPVSAAAPVAITISEEPPRLSAVEALDFGPVFIGQPREEQIVLQNSGGGVLEGRMEVPFPWKILGDSEYRIGRQGTRKVRITCDPSRPQEYTGELTFSHDAARVIRLLASATPPLSFEPSNEISLAARGESSVRSGAVLVRNQTAQERIVRISVPPEVVSPGEVAIAAGEEKEIALATKREFLGPKLGNASFASEGFQQDIPIRIFALRPVLKIEPHEGLDFGDVEIHKSCTGVLRIKNEGGSPAWLQVNAPEGITLAPDPNGASLRPGELRAFAVKFAATSLGPYQSPIVFGTAAGVSAKVEVYGRVLLRPARMTAISALDPAPRQVLPAAGAPEGPGSAVPAVTDIKVLRATNRIFEIAWPQPATGPLTWIVQQLQFDFASDGTLGFVWRDLHGINFSEREGMVVARLQNLEPGRVWLLRIISADDHGLRSPPSPTLRLLSAPPRRFPVFWTMAPLAAACALAWGLAKIRQRRQSEALREADRIARLVADKSFR
jgi:hypothetical protein